MASVFKRPKRVAQLGRNGFDMSQRRIFSSPCGMLLPTYSDFANPGDKYKLNSRTFVRTQPLQSSAFVRFKAHVDWFFVPITQLYSLWNEFYNMTNDVMSSIFSSAPRLTLPLGTSVPLVAPENDSFTAIKGDVSGVTHVSLKVDEFGVPLAFNVRRLYDMLYGRVPFVSSAAGTFNILPLMAYHKIFHSHYRNTDYTPNEPETYSLDKFYSTEIIPIAAMFPYFKIHYRPWRKDMFTSIQPAPIFGNGFESFISDIPEPNPSYGFGSFFPEASLSSVISLTSQTGGVTGSTSPTSTSRTGIGLSRSDNQFFTVGDIRASFALDKLLRITAQTGAHYEEQTLAHFGYKVPQGIAKEAYYLGEQVTDININEVVATATTGSKEAGGVIGDIAGKGFGYTGNSKDIEFTCPSHGYIMAIYSIEPIADYRFAGDETEKYRYSFDFYHPEFDGIGMQPYGYSSPSSSTQPISIFGWQYRYMQHKTKLDSVHESIYGTPFDTWALTRESSYVSGPVTGPAEDPTSSVGPVDIPLVGRFYIFPQYTNGVFLGSFASYNQPTTAQSLDAGVYHYEYNSNTPRTQWASKELSAERVYGLDGFLNVVDHNVFKTSCMSVYSLPNM